MDPTSIQKILSATSKLTGPTVRRRNLMQKLELHSSLPDENSSQREVKTKGMCSLCGVITRVVVKALSQEGIVSHLKQHFPQDKTTSFCQPCHASVQQIEELHNQMQSKNDEIIAISAAVKAALRLRNQSSWDTTESAQSLCLSITGPQFVAPQPSTLATQISVIKIEEEALSFKTEEGLEPGLRDGYAIQEETLVSQIEIHEPFVVKDEPDDEMMPKVAKSTGQKKRKPNSVKLVECYFCHKLLVVRQLQNLIIHYRLHTREGFFSRCQQCGKAFRNPNLLTQHGPSTCTRRKLKINPYFGGRKVKCYFCHKLVVVRHPNVLEAHYQLHTNEGFFSRCGQCGKSFRTLKALREHCPTTCTRRKFNKNPYAGGVDMKCYFCKKLLVIHHVKMMETHYQLHTKEGKVSKCVVCRRGFTTARGLREHVVAKHGTYEEKQAQLEKRLQRRLLTLNKSPALCYFCGLKHYKFCDLVKHVNYVHIKEVIPLACRKCGKTYPYKHNLQQHEQRGCQLPVKKNKKVKKPPTECYFCRKPFDSHYHLEEHLRTHTKEPELNKCNHCGKILVSKKNLGQHITVFHGSREERNALQEKRRAAVERRRREKELREILG